MPEMLAVTAAVAGAGLGKDVALITDGRFSGATKGIQRRPHRARGVRRRPDRARARGRPDRDRRREPPDRPGGSTTRSSSAAAPRGARRPRYTQGALAKYARTVAGRRPGRGDVVTHASVAIARGARSAGSAGALPGRAAHDLRGVLRPARAGVRPRSRSTATAFREHVEAGPASACGATSSSCPAVPASSGSISAPGSRRCVGPTTSPSGSGSTRCGSRTTR